jgi:hypothetical protein
MLADYFGRSVVFDHGTVVLDVSALISYGDNSFMEIHRLQFDAMDSLYLNSSGFYSYLPLKYQFYGEIAGAVPEDSIYIRGLGLRYVFDTTLHSYDSCYGFYLMHYDSAGNNYSEELGGVSGIDSLGRGYVYLNNFRILSSLDSYTVIVGCDSGVSIEIVKETFMPLVYNLHNNRPNPFNPMTAITYDIPFRNGSTRRPDKAVAVRLAVYDIKGRRVASLVNGPRKPGRYTVIWNGLSFSGKEAVSGLYILKIRSGHYSKTVKMMLIR